MPTFHGVVVRKDFAEKYPEVVVAYLKAMIAADDWVRKDPQRASEQIEDWTKINKEVVYIFLGPGGIMTLDPTIKQKWVDAMHVDYGVLSKLKLIKSLDLDKWVNDKYVREAYKDDGLNYDKQEANFSGYNVTGQDPVCNAPVTDPKQAGQIWIEGGDIIPLSSAACTLSAVTKYTKERKKIDAAYVVDHSLGIKVFADAAFYSVTGNAEHPSVTPFLLKGDAMTYASKVGGRFATYSDAMAAVAAAAH